MAMFNVVQPKPYTNKSGEEKSRWVKVGKAFTDDNGSVSIYLDALPLPDKEGNCKLKLFEDDGNYSKPNQSNSNNSANDNDIPF